MLKRKRTRSRLLLPMAIFMYLIGWIIVTVGSNKEMNKKTAIPHPESLHKKDATFINQLFETDKLLLVKKDSKSRKLFV
jgi:hypothetical protein